MRILMAVVMLLGDTVVATDCVAFVHARMTDARVIYVEMSQSTQREETKSVD